MRLALGGVLVALTLLGCGSEPNDTPPLGRYSLSVEGQRLGAHQGTMILTYSTVDSIAGRIDVPELDDSLRFGFVNIDAYVVGFTLQRFAGLVTLRLVQDGSTGLRCVSGRFNDGDVSQGVTCMTAYQGP